MLTAILKSTSACINTKDPVDLGTFGLLVGGIWVGGGTAHPDPTQRRPRGSPSAQESLELCRLTSISAYFSVLIPSLYGPFRGAVYNPCIGLPYGLVWALPLGPK